jgi:hypothetical protein
MFSYAISGSSRLVGVSQFHVGDVEMPNRILPLKRLASLSSIEKLDREGNWYMYT